MFSTNSKFSAKMILGVAAAALLSPALSAQHLTQLRLPKVEPTREPMAFTRPHFVVNAATPADLSAPPTSAFTPTMIRHAYGFDTLANQGAGQTIAVVDAYDDANIEADLETFSAEFELPECTSANGCFTKLYASGQQPAASAQWALETALDVEWVHAIAPQAKIILVEANSYALPDLLVGVDLAVGRGASVVSMSWTTAEFPGERSDDSHFTASGVSFVAASGDSGAGVNYPAASPYVLSVGGTSLTLNAAHNYGGEVSWSGSGGGLSVYENEPLYQESYGVPNDGAGFRAVPDVSYNANPGTGYAVYNSIPYQNAAGWFQVGGTSAATPQWAAGMAIVNSMRAASGKSPLTNLNSMIYPNNSRADSLNFFAVNSTMTCLRACRVVPGFDPFTGLGSPQAKNLIPSLAVR
jgi:subtilase family serine protease